MDKPSRPARKTGRSIMGWAMAVLVVAAGLGGYRVYHEYLYQNEVLKQMITRLEADSRVAEVLVTDVSYNPILQRHMTTIKFLEYDSAGQPLAPKYFTFDGNLIQFQSLVVRFDDLLIKEADPLRGRSAYLFWKAFVLDGKNTQEYVITEARAVPEGYKIAGPHNAFEDELWQEFWSLALDSKKAISKGIKNAQVEAPGTRFVPGILYTLKIEHDGGIRIDTARIPDILRGERISPEGR